MASSKSAGGATNWNQLLLLGTRVSAMIKRHDSDLNRKEQVPPSSRFPVSPSPLAELSRMAPTTGNVFF